LRRTAALAVISVLAAASAAGAGERGAPRRVVSLNPCLDAILLDVADPSQIAALSRYSHNPEQSAAWAEARRYPATSGSADEIVALRPDLVLISGMGAAGLTGVLPRLGVASASFGVPSSVAQSEAQVRRVARLVGHPDRGEALVARIEAALAAAAPAPGTPRPSALVYVSQGFASGPGTLMDELMRRAGFDNAVRRYGFTRSADVPLELVVADPPQVLLAGRLAPGEPTWADRVISHPALRAVAGRMKREAFPQTLLFCAGPVMIPALDALSAARRDAVGSPPG
jgi:iron complex transport system substrate-binding protein